MTSGAQSARGTKPTRKAVIRDLFSEALVVFIHSLTQLGSGSCHSQTDAIGRENR
jgi:hypothetical protein